MSKPLLFANDVAGQYPNSWYAATADFMPPQPPLQGAQTCDVAIVGAGYTGLSAALHLAQAGLDVRVLEAQRVGFGASGRNGGQLWSGQRQGQPYLERLMGRDDARKLWDLGEEAKALVHHLIAAHQIDCDYHPGLAYYGFSKGEMQGLHADADYLQDNYGYDHITKLDADRGRAYCTAAQYHGGVLDMGAGHLHPLKFALGLARAAQSAGAVIYEGSHVTKITPGARPVLHTDQGQLQAGHVILAGNGYLEGLAPKVSARVLPINNYILVTEPLGDTMQSVLPQAVAVGDTKFVVNYYRPTPDGRLLFGGGESYGLHFPRDIAAKPYRPMVDLFPQLKGVRVDYAWGGTLGITMRRMPYLVRLSDNMLSASGYSGHGLGTATHAGALMAQAILGQADGFNTMARIPCAPFPGGRFLRSPLMALAMTWFALRDRLGV